LIAFGAAYRGLSEFSCHGGVSLVAAPGDGSSAYDPAESVVVASCAFAHRDHASGWKAARAHACDLPLDLAELERAYRALPALTDDKVDLVNGIVDATAAAVDEIRCRVAGVPRSGTDARRRDGKEVEARIGDALTLSCAESARRRSEATGKALVQLVRAMVSRDPGLPFTVAGIARAARITPNYFSALFRKHTGETFVAFLNGCRVDLARTHLRDLRLSVAEVADMSGFSDASYFGRRFKQATGQTPEAWRRSSTRA
jgi:AraC-like DNA-binding protein